MVRPIRILSVCIIFFCINPRLAYADILFEGYSKIVSGKAHIGYVISRYEFDQKKKQFISTYFLKTGKGNGEVTESLKAVADAELAPIYYEYTSLSGKDSKTIDAKFKAGAMSATVKTNGKISRIEKKIPKGTFLSTFLVYLMLKSKEGLKAETNYDYQAIAEEDAGIYKGQALVGKLENYRGFQVFKILNTFKDSKFLSYINDRGEVLGTDALGAGIATELVEKASEATANQAYSANILTTLFGKVPSGEDNVIFRAQRLKEAEAKEAPASKQMGIPQGTPGKNIQIKTQKSESTEQGK